MAVEESSGWDFVEWVGADISACVFRSLDDPADLARVAAVSRSWLRFVIDNEFCKGLCLRICPEVATIARAAEVNRPPPSLAAAAAAHTCGSSHDAELRNRESEHRVYSHLGGSLVSSEPSMDCILHCIGASSTDRFPDERMENTLEPREMVGYRPSYWSSRGEDDPDVPESLTYRLNSDLCIVDEIRIQPSQEYYGYDPPVYSSKMVRFRMGHPKFTPRSDEDKNQADENYVWTYTSPEFPMLQENVLQSFKLPRPVLVIGGVVKIELLGRIAKAIDDRYYICICHAKVIGRSLPPVFMVDIADDPAGYSNLKYLPQARN